MCARYDKQPTEVCSNSGHVGLCASGRRCRLIHYTQHCTTFKLRKENDILGTIFVDGVTVSRQNGTCEFSIL